jgi:hypothetical protein
MARDERVVVSFRDPQHRQPGALAHVVDLDQDVVLNQPPDQVAAEGREPLGVAVPARGIARDRYAQDAARSGEEPAQELKGAEVQRRHLLALTRLGAPSGVEVVASLQSFEHVDERAPRAALERRTAERVVHPVGNEHRPNAEALVVADAAVHIRAGALRLALELAAVEEVG